MSLDANKIFKDIAHRFCAGHQPDVKWVYGEDIPAIVDGLFERVFDRYGVWYVAHEGVSRDTTVGGYLNDVVDRTEAYYAEEMESVPNPVLMAGLRDIVSTVDAQTVLEAYAALQEKVSELARENLNDMINGRACFPHSLIGEMLDDGAQIIERAIDAAHDKKAA
jgi:hypothetical protein